MGRLSSQSSDTPPTRRWSAIFFVCVLAPNVLSIGCEASRSDSVVPKQADNRAQADFDWAMKRLRRAIETFTPSANRGLKMKRELSYELIPPDASHSHYTAQIVVKSKTVYQPERFFPTVDEEVKPAKTFRSQAADRISEDELLADSENDSPDFQEDANFQEDFAEEPAQQAMIVDSLVDAPSIKERIVYELVYRDNRWQLETPPDSKHEQMWFEYALQQ